MKIMNFCLAVTGLASIVVLVACSGGGGGAAGGPGAGQNSVVTSQGTAPASICPNGGIQVDAGIDANSNGVLDASEIRSTQYVCNGANGANGANGSNGTNGQTTLVSLTSEPTGTFCQYGGSKVCVGLDANGNKVLDTAEISSCDRICSGAPGSDGTNGTPGANSAAVTSFHGAALLKSNAKAVGRVFATAAITSATAAVNGTVTIDFTLADDSGNPVTDASSVSATIANLAPAGGGESFAKWVPYIYRTQTVMNSANGDWPNPDGTAAEQGYRESSGILTNHGDGSYTYVFAANISGVTAPVSGMTITYDRSLTHRVSVMVGGGGSGASAEAVYDFVPDGSGITQSRDIVRTAACRECHGEDFSYHGNDRRTVENCVICHAPGSADPHSGETLDFKVMVHKIHAGGELASIPGTDGIVWDNPATMTDESADNGQYALWGAGDAKKTWWKSKFPAVLGNCEKCHQGAGAEKDNWKNVPSRAACGSCHDVVSFVTGATHSGGAQADDSLCAICHTPSGGGLSPITEAHDWTAKDPRNIPEFDIDLSVSTPANDSYFVPGESPVVTVVVKESGSPIGHLTLATDPAPEGCLISGCPSGDGLFFMAELFMHGPRANRNPVLTTKARVKMTSPATGPYNISAAGATLTLKVDNGEDLRVVDASGADKVLSGSFSVPVSGGMFASTAAATPAEIVAWLNNYPAFNARAIAYLEPSGKVSIRSRNLGKLFAIQGVTSAVNTAVFSDDVTIHVIGGSIVSNLLAHQSNPANNDPKVAWFDGNITYTLDPVDDLKPGTYVVSVRFADRGRISSTNYKTPTKAKTTFQVKTAAEEKAPAGNCNLCHAGQNNKGFIHGADRYNIPLDSSAQDYCGACHDNQPQQAAGDWVGAGNLVRRVHAVHFGSGLNYPLSTVGYVNGDMVVGRNWNITYSQDIRNCETCHPGGTTSGSWKKNATRLSCGGCHDSDAAVGHMKSQTFDPTPADPWSGDEQESCNACHRSPD